MDLNQKFLDNVYEDKSNFSVIDALSAFTLLTKTRYKYR